MAYLSNKLEQISSNSNSATYRLTVTIDRQSSFFGIDPSTNYIAVKNHDGTVLNYIGWPKKSSWPVYATDGKWHWPVACYQNDSYINPGPGNAQCKLLDNFVYTRDFTVTIDKGNQRKGSKTIYAGAEGKYSDGNFGISLAKITLSTTEIPEPEFKSQPTIKVTEQNITIKANFSNPENYYTVKLYDKNTGAVLDTYKNVTTFTKVIPLTKEMFGTAVSYVVKIIGKDTKTYRTSTTISASIPKKGFAIYGKKSNSIKDLEKLYFRNVSNKEPKEVWVKINGKIKQSEK